MKHLIKIQGGFLLLLLVISPILTIAQWQPNPYTSGNIHFTTGNVGIGIVPTGSFKLHVLGNTYLQGSTEISGNFRLNSSVLQRYPIGSRFSLRWEGGTGYYGGYDIGDHLEIQGGPGSTAGDLKLSGGFSEFGYGGKVIISGGDGAVSDDLLGDQNFNYVQGGNVEIRAGNSINLPGSISLNPGHGDGYPGLSTEAYGSIFMSQYGGPILIGTSASNSPVKMNLVNGDFIVGSTTTGYNNIQFKSNGNSFINGGNFGIGTENPNASLEIFRGSSNNVALILRSSSTGWGSGMRFKNSSEFGIYSGLDGKWHFTHHPSSASESDLMVLTTSPESKLTVNGVVNATGFLQNGAPFSPSQWTTSGNLIYYSGGNVGIGTTSTGSFRLAVEGKIAAREVQVTVSNPWPDYVFEPNYKLPSLFEVEKFISINHHLPEIPSAAEVNKNGHELGEMDALLLKKIEELTLYIIDLKKEVDSIKNENDKLRSNLKNQQ